MDELLQWQRDFIHSLWSIPFSELLEEVAWDCPDRFTERDKWKHSKRIERIKELWDER
jgi:hypothetical protein